MATVEMVQQSLKSQVTTALAGTNILLYNAAVLPAPNVGLDWPSIKDLQALSVGTPPVISIFDRGVERNDTHSIPLLNVFPSLAVASPGAVITLNQPLLLPGETITLTGSGTPIKNDAFCLTLMYGQGDPSQLFANYTSGGSDTLISALDGMVTQINLLTDIVAIRSSNVITVTNNTNITFNVRSEVTNIAPVTVEGFRWNRDVQVTLWTKTYQDRNRYGDVLEQLFSQLEVNFGFLTSDNSACRVIYKDDLVHKDSQLQDIYRRDFLLSINYPVLNVLPAYPIETIPQTFGILD